MLAILSPVFLIVSMAIKIDSPGPVLFWQERVTQYGNLFNIYKFRTMVQNADSIGPKIAADHDARVTKVGRLLRRRRLDEIPQLLNIIKGEMTFVGIRPEVVKFVDQYTDEMMATLLLPAGVTSEASIYYKNEESMLKFVSDTEQVYMSCILPEKMELNLNSLKKYGFWSNIGVILKTIIEVAKKDKNLDYII